jgi:hypothetical protein
MHRDHSRCGTSRTVLEYMFMMCTAGAGGGEVGAKTSPPWECVRMREWCLSDVRGRGFGLFLAQISAAYVPPPSGEDRLLVLMAVVGIVRK